LRKDKMSATTAINSHINMALEKKQSNFHFKEDILRLFIVLQTY